MTETIVEILIDLSGSMGYMKGAGIEHENKYLIDGLTRMTLLKKVLTEQVIPTIDYSNQIIIRTFRCNSKKIKDKTIEEPSTPVIYQGAFDKPKILSIVSALQDPSPGGTPITAAINAAITDLEKHSNSDRKIILLTDGEENGDGDFREAAKKAEKLNGIPCKIFIIGLAQDKESEVKSRSIASGGYYNIKSKSFTADEVNSVLAPLKTAVLKNTIQNIQAVNNNIQPQSIVQPQNIVQTVEKKIETIEKENQKATTLKLEDLENKIKEQILNSQKLLTELSSLKELFRVNTLLETGIDSTTLTIDNEYSESIRQRSELFLYKILCVKHGITNVKWLNEKTESFSHYDFEVLDADGKVKQLIECKGTTQNKQTFYLTANEWEYFLINKEIYQVYRVFNVDGDMNAVCIDNLFNSIIDRQVVPYLMKPEILKEGRVFLTLMP